MTVFDKVPHWMEPIFKFMIPNREVALFMQKFMSIVEIFLALALIFGLFTWIAAAATAALTVMFSLSGMFYWVNIWFIPVAIALMNGSGRSFGLDKWVQPWIQRWLTKIWYGQSRSIYKGRQQKIALRSYFFCLKKLENYVMIFEDKRQFKNYLCKN